MRRPRHVDGARRWLSTKISCSPNSFDSLHRRAGPAVEFPNGHKQWHWHGAWKYEEVISLPWMMRRRGLARLKESNKGIFDGLRASSFDMDGNLKSLLPGYGKAKR